ncbi:MAG: AraC family transcriptional regulator [bacterium]
MSKLNLILYSKELPNCNCYSQILNKEFNCYITTSETVFIRKSQHGNADAAIVCFCSAKEKEAIYLLQLNALTGLIPVLSFCKTLTIDFVQMAAKQGFDRFLDCNMEKDKILTLIYNAIRRGDLHQFLKSWCQGNRLSSPKVRRIILEVTKSFPSWLGVKELAKKMGISERWLQKICCEAFGITYSRLRRLVWIHQALRMMKYTGLDNTEIALQLNYREESHLARDIRKELGYNPTEARRRLTEKSPDGLIQEIASCF